MHFLYKNKLYKNNETETVKKKKNKLRTFLGWEVQKQKSDAIRCCIDVYNVILLNSSIAIFCIPNIVIQRELSMFRVTFTIKALVI